jgi:hypothetical protein
MKTAKFLIIAICIVLLYSCETKTEIVNTPVKDTLIPKANIPITFLKSLDKKDILQAFFKPSKIINDTAYWKQDLESLDMRVSDDGYIHTNIDTIFTIEDLKIILFVSYETSLNGTPRVCHPCNVDYSIAVIEKDDSINSYSIRSFKKYLTTKGSMGSGAYLTLVDFKYHGLNTLTCLKFKDGWIGCGTVMSATEYFNIGNFTSALYLETHNSNEGMCDENDYKCINKTEREVIPYENHPSKNPAIIINYKHTYFDKELIIIQKSDTLIYDGYHFNKDIYYEGV